MGLGFFRGRSAPPATPQPDPAAATLVAEPIFLKLHPAKPDAARGQTILALNGADEIAADEYLKWHPIQSEAAKKSEGAKKRLLASLGSYAVGRLPGGRLVRKFVTPVAAESTPRVGYNRTSITIE